MPPYSFLPSSLSSPQVSYIVSAIQAGAVGTQACNEAISTIMGIIGDLETTAMFCTAGALNPEGKPGSFSDHRSAGMNPLHPESNIPVQSQSSSPVLLLFPSLLYLLCVPSLSPLSPSPPHLSLYLPFLFSLLLPLTSLSYPPSPL